MSAPFAFPPPPPPPPKAGSRTAPSSSDTGYQHNGTQGHYRTDSGNRGYDASYRGGRGDHQARGGRGSRGQRGVRWQGNSQRGGSGNEHAAYGRQTEAPAYSHNAYMNNGQATSSQPYTVPAPHPGNASHSSHDRDKAARYQEGRRGRGRGNSSPNKPPTKPRPGVAPSVPSFGFQLPTPVAPPPPLHTKPQKKKRKIDGLGLIPAEDEKYSSEEEGDVDEEAQWADNAGPITLEHNGRIVKLSSAAELAAWKAERKREFPTRARIEDKKRETAEKYAKLVQLQKEQHKAKHGIKDAPPARQQEAKKSDPAVIAGEAQRRQEDQRQEQARLRAKLLESRAARQDLRHSQKRNHESMTQSDTAISKPTASGPSLGLDYTTDSSAEASAAEASASDVSSVVSSSSDSDSDASDAAPEVQSTKTVQPPVARPPPQQKKRPETPRPRRTCATFQMKGSCKFGNRCKDEHVQEVRKRTTLWEKFRVQEQEAEDRLALEAIKWLGKKGFLE